MTKALLLIPPLLALANCSYAQASYKLTFDAKYTYGVIHTPSAFTLPASTTIEVNFTPLPSGALISSGGTTSLRLISGNNAVIADSPVFTDFPLPHISWSSGATGGEVRIERNDTTLQYRFVVSTDLSYSLGCVLGCTNYFKAISLISNYAVAENFSPFDNPARFISTLYETGTRFESAIFQDSWYRANRRDYYSGAFISTSYNTLGFGQYWQDGGAQISSFAAPVPEQSTYLMLIAGITIVGYRRRALLKGTAPSDNTYGKQRASE